MGAPISDKQGAIYLELCTQVGHLFLSFANLEGVLAAILKLHMAQNIDPEANKHGSIALASAVYGSMRFSTARDIIKRITATEAQSPQKLNFLIDLFAQIGEVQKFRDMLAHQQLSPANPSGIDGEWQISNLFTTKDIHNPHVFTFTLDVVNAASGDLMLATSRLGGQVVTEALIDGVVQNLAPIPWQYKPSMLKRVPRNKLRFPQEPFPQPPSLRE